MLLKRLKRRKPMFKSKRDHAVVLVMDKMTKRQAAKMIGETVYAVQKNAPHAHIRM